MNINMKSEKGITMIAIVITIIILLIIISTVSFSSKNGIDMKNLNNMNSDIILLEEKVSLYYLKNGALPIGKPVVFTEEDATKVQPVLLADNPNNLDGVFYEIDLDKLENISLNNANSTNDKDKYIINSKSHSIYYLKGVKISEYRAGLSGAQEKIYYGIVRDYEEIDVKNTINEVLTP